MKKITIITNSCMNINAGDIALISRRATALQKEYEIDTTCLVLNKLYISNEISGIKSIIKVTPLSLIKYLDKNESDMIVFYGVKSYLYIPIIKYIIKKNNFKSKLFLDFQGVIEESIEFCTTITKINLMKFFIKKQIIKISLNSVNGAFIVSDFMKEYCRELQKNKSLSFKTIKLRCGIQHVLSCEDKIKNREDVRKEWGIDEKQIVFCFSGFRYAWQKIDETINIFKTIDNQYSNVFFAFYCNIDSEFEELLERSFPKKNYILKFLSSEEYFKYLSACDIGFLMRDYNITNRVAFPNKFSDYLNAGLLLYMTDSLKEPYQLLENYNIPFIDYLRDTEDIIFEKIKNRQNNLEIHYRLTEFLCENELSYLKQIHSQEFYNYLTEGTKYD